MLGLAFSGGKDSLACWYLKRHLDPLVFWVNTGKAYPETLKIIELVRRCSRFVEVKTNQESQTKKTGLPSDIVPVDHTTFGMLFSGKRETKVQSYLECCYTNISRPLLDAAKARGITKLIYGQRNDESHTAPIKDGEMIEGITRIHPVENWTSRQILDFLHTKMEIPDHFRLEHSSLDCYDCTAYLAHSKDRVEWMQKKYPILFEEWKGKMELLKETIKPSIESMDYGRL